MNRLFLVLLATSALTACATSPSPVYIKPQCSPPVRPALPVIDAGKLWDDVGEVGYNALLTREVALSGWALEMHAMLDELCEH